MAFVTRPRLVCLHGSVTGASRSWRRQRPLAARFELVLPARPGFAGGPPAPRVDFEAERPWLVSTVRPGDHLVAHSYAGVVALVAAPTLPLASLTLIEPPAFRVAGDHPAVRAWIDGAAALPDRDPRAYTKAFLAHVGAPFSLPEELPADLAADVEAFAHERRPTEAEVPLEPVPYPVLVVTGAHEPAFEAVADVLCERLPAGRVVLPGAGHAVQNAPGFNEALERFVLAA